MIRHFTAQERELFYTLNDEFYHSPAVLYPVDPKYYVKTFDAAMQNSPFVDLFLIATDDGQSAGFGMVTFSFSTFLGGKVVWLEDIYIRPQFQGMGLGGQYLQDMHARYPDAACFRLEIEPENQGAARLYERHGYDYLGYRQMYRQVKEGDCAQ